MSEFAVLHKVICIFQFDQIVTFSQFHVPQYLSAGYLKEEDDIVNCNGGNIKRILMTNEV